MEAGPTTQEVEAATRAQRLGLASPRYECCNELVIAGLNEHYTAETRSNIPAQWHQFAPHIGKVPGQIGASTYGVCWNANPNCEFDYLAGVEVTETAHLPPEFTKVTIPARRYAVFTHDQHVTSLPNTIDAIWSKWAPQSGLQIAKAPCFERYTAE